MMIGRRIVSSPQPQSSKSTPLTINVDYAKKWSTPLQERTNGGIIDPPSLVPARTPQTSNTFGIPRSSHRNFSLKKYRQPSSPSSSTSSQAGRQKLKQRYSVAEQTLIDSLQHCSTPASSHELQKRALEQATDLLIAHSIEAEERAAIIRTSLGDRNIDPLEYEALQRERWMEERRQLAIEEECKAAKRRLESFENSTNDERQNLSAAEKREANLARFFATSSSKAPISSTHTAGVTRRIDRSPRRMTVGAPMRLRNSLTPRPFSWSIPEIQRPVSMGAKSLKRKTAGSTQLVPADIPLQTVPEVPSSHGTPSLASSVSSQPSVSTDNPYSPSLDYDSKNGTVLIYSSNRRSASEITGSADIQVQLPEYALHLLEDFDSEDAPLSLGLIHESRKSREWDVLSLRTLAAARRSVPSYPTYSDLDAADMSNVPNDFLSPGKSNLNNKPSKSRLVGLFAIPEAITSRIGLSSEVPSSSTLRRNASTSFFTRKKSDEPDENPSPSKKKRFSKLVRRHH